MAKVMLITGASSGIGEATAHRLGGSRAQVMTTTTGAAQAASSPQGEQRNGDAANLS